MQTDILMKLSDVTAKKRYTYIPIQTPTIPQCLYLNNSRIGVFFIAVSKWNLFLYNVKCYICFIQLSRKRSSVKFVEQLNTSPRGLSLDERIIISANPLAVSNRVFGKERERQKEFHWFRLRNFWKSIDRRHAR